MQQKKNYEQDYSHTHCFEDTARPEHKDHFWCCICLKPKENSKAKIPNYSWQYKPAERIIEVLVDDVLILSLNAVLVPKPVESSSTEQDKALDDRSYEVGYSDGQNSRSADIAFLLDEDEQRAIKVIRAELLEEIRTELLSCVTAENDEIYFLKMKKSSPIINSKKQ